MATYKVVDADQLNADMTSVADSIRAKGNTTNKLAWPDGYKTAIAAIQTGGGGSAEPAKENDVMFLDYDGTILYSYTAEEALALTAMPPLPSQPGLVCQGWNWSYENMHGYVDNYGKCIIGATYITDDGKTRIYITLSEGRTSPVLGCCPNGTVTVDWGDGTTPDTLTGTSTEVVKWTPNHNYAAPGDYVISLSVNGEMGFLGDSYNWIAAILTASQSFDDPRNIVYNVSVKKIEVGNSVTSIGYFAFSYCSALASISIPDSVTSIGEEAFSYCSALASISIPDSVTSIGEEAFRYCYVLASISIPDSVTSIGNYAFSNCYVLASISIPDSVTSVGNYAFGYCSALTSVTISDSDTSIGDCAFFYCTGLAKIRFERNTPPTVASANAWGGVPDDCVISVPTGSLSAYTSATNYPDPATYTYIEED